MARVIKREKKDYLATAQNFNFKTFNLLIPSWWSVKTSEENLVTYYRADTYYDWKAKFIWIPFEKEVEELSLKDYFAGLIIKKGILFDSHEVIINQYTKCIRVEGTATENDEHRIYYDALLVKDKKQKGYLFCENRSSILNGMLEGPYFEEVITRLRKSLENNFEKQF
ncbi:MAG: hypothetical protein HN576_06965 [Bacteriovoracaceae bacterium]|nr:hypothetical protein [Bacteriovoracaceae bacterium]